MFVAVFLDPRDLGTGFHSSETPAFMLCDPKHNVYYENFVRSDITEGCNILVRTISISGINNYSLELKDKNYHHMCRYGRNISVVAKMAKIGSAENLLVEYCGDSAMVKGIRTWGNGTLYSLGQRQDWASESVQLRRL
jgi:hypothetical protein